MFVKNIELEGFRNYGLAETSFDPKVNVIIGDNGQGKTNLLESIYYLTCAKSFRTRYDREVIGFDREFSRIYSEFFLEGRTQKIEINIRRGVKKQLILNGVKLKKASELSGKLMAVLFSPDDLSIVRAGASLRRGLMDTAICQMRPKYRGALGEFLRLYEHKTRILRDFREKPSLLSALDDFNTRLAKVGGELIYYRASFVKKLELYANTVHNEFSGGKEELTLDYKTVKTVKDPFKKPAELFSDLMEHQLSHRQREIDSGLCLSGAHKDDIEIKINGISARSFASQGQARTAALSIKLAERDIFKGDTGEYPILLLDDVLSELDAARQDYVLNSIQDGQVFITCCEDQKIAERTGGKILRIERGRIY